MYKRQVLVIGDVMLDTYHIGDVKRISPEAPVPEMCIRDRGTTPFACASVKQSPHPSKVDVRHTTDASL